MENKILFTTKINGHKSPKVKIRATGLQRRERQREFGKIAAPPSRAFQGHAAPSKDGRISQIWRIDSKLHTEGQISTKSKDKVEGEENTGIDSTWFPDFRNEPRSKRYPVKKTVRFLEVMLEDCTRWFLCVPFSWSLADVLSCPTTHGDAPLPLALPRLHPSNPQTKQRRKWPIYDIGGQMRLPVRIP